MKQILLSAAVLLGVGLQAQVGVNTEDPKATLEVKAKEKTGTANEGIIAPMLSKARVANIKNPVEGTLIYVIDDADKGGTISSYTGNNDKVANITEKGYYYYDGSAWVKSSGTASFTATNGLTKSGNEVTLGGTLSKDTNLALGGKKLQLTGEGRIGIGAAPSQGRVEITENGWFPLILRSTRATKENDRVQYTGGGLAMYVSDWEKRVGLSVTNEGDFRVWNQEANKNSIYIDGATGKVALGKDHPEAQLDVAGEVKINTIGECADCDQILVTGADGVVKKISLAALSGKISGTGGGTNTLPKYTNSQRNGLTNVEEGTMIYNTDSHKVEVYNGRGWTTVSAESVTYTSTKTGSASGQFTRNNCANGQTGTTVTITKTATETRSSTVSQAEADRLAQDAANAAAESQLNENGQKMANIQGKCINAPTPPYGPYDVCNDAGKVVGRLYDHQLYQVNTYFAISATRRLSCSIQTHPGFTPVYDNVYIQGYDVNHKKSIWRCHYFNEGLNTSSYWETFSYLRKCK